MQIDRSRSLSPVMYVPLLGLVLAGLLVAFADSFGAMVGIWLGSATFNHCLLIPLAVAVLIWRRRDNLAKIPPCGSVLGLGAFAAMAGIWMLGSLANVLTLQNFAIVAMISTSVWAVLGWSLFRAMAFPLAYLFLMVPFGEFLMPKLMEMTADFTVVAVRTSGVPVYKDGLFFTIPNGSFKIVEACSGIRMLIASIAIGVLFAHVSFTSWTRRIAFVVAMIFASLLANGFRAYGVVMTGHYLGMETIADHLMFGYVVFGIVIFLMLSIGSRYADADAFTVADMEPPSRGYPGSIRSSVFAAVAALAISFAVPAVVVKMNAATERVPNSPSPVLPAVTSPWLGPERVDVDWSPQYVGHDATLVGQYSGPAGVVDVYLIWYRRQAQGAELISGQNAMFDSAYWTQIQVQPGRTKVGDGRLLDYTEMELRSLDGGKRLVRYWYVIDGTPTHRPWRVKLHELLNSLVGRATPASLVAISSRFGDDRGLAAEALDAFVTDVYAPVLSVPTR